MRGIHNDRLPERFDEQVSLEIEEPDDEDSRARMQDDQRPDAWIEAKVSALASLPEYR